MLRVFFQPSEEAKGKGILKRVLGAEAFTAGTMGGSGGIGDLEAAFLEIVAVVEEGTRDKAGALGVHHHVDVVGADKNVAVGGAVDEVHLVLQAGAAAADD